MISKALLLLALLTSTGISQISLRRQEDPIPPSVELIYSRGLKHLAESQEANGAWPQHFGKEPGVVGLAVMAFLAHGEDPQFGPYSEQISKGIDFLISQQNTRNGYIGNSMYSHGFATLALAECYGMYPDDRIGKSLQSAVELILSAQKRNPRGGWRYSPEDNTADTSVVGCNLVALYAARNAGIPVPEKALKKAHAYMLSCRNSNGAYGYTSPGSRVTLTAIGLLCEALEKKHERTSFKETTAFLAKNLNFRDSHYPYYFEYYMSQALFHADEELWQKWNQKNIRYLKAIQASDGSFPGNRGSAFTTSGALLSLALNYRFLPIYEK